MTYVSENFSDYLKSAMSRGGVRTGELAEFLGVKSQSVSQWRSGRTHPKGEFVDQIRGYLEGKISEKNLAHSEMGFPKKAQNRGGYGLVEIPQYDIEASAGPGLEVPDCQNPAKVWTIPREALNGVQATSLANLAIIIVRGESMQPDYLPGEHVLIDTGDRVVTHDGAYVLWNSFGLVIKLIQLLPPSAQSAAQLRIISKNPDFPPYEMPVEDVQISGRVVGKWVWK